MFHTPPTLYPSIYSIEGPRPPQALAVDNDTTVLGRQQTPA